MNLSQLDTMDETALAALDPNAQRELFELLVAKQQAATTSGGEELTATECRKAVHLTRLLRRTNTGPARAKAAKKTPKKELTKAAIDSLMNGD